MARKTYFFRILLRCAVAALAAVPCGAAAQATYPVKPIRWIVPFPPGGSTTIVARLLGQKLGESLGQQIVVDNRGGGNTIIGSEAMVRSAPDGYTILHVTTTHVINPSLLATPYDAVKDFAPITTTVVTEILMVVNPSLPATTLQQFIALAKAKPGQLNYGTSGSGTTNHLAIELFSMMAGIRMQHVPYKGAGPGVTDLIGGQIQLFMNNALPLTPFVKAGKLRAIAISGETRLKSLPDVPTFTQGGLPGYEVKSWQGLLAPVKTPKPIVDKLSEEIARILRTPDVAERFVDMGADPFINGPQQFAALIRTDLVRYAKLIKTANIKLEN